MLRPYWKKRNISKIPPSPSYSAIGGGGSKNSIFSFNFYFYDFKLTEAILWGCSGFRAKYFLKLTTSFLREKIYFIWKKIFDFWLHHFFFRFFSKFFFEKKALKFWEVANFKNFFMENNLRTFVVPMPKILIISHILFLILKK